MSSISCDTSQKQCFMTRSCDKTTVCVVSTMTIVSITAIVIGYLAILNYLPGLPQGAGWIMVTLGGITLAKMVIAALFEGLEIAIDRRLTSKEQ